MNLRWQLTAGIVLLVALTTAVAWAVSAGGVLRPFERQVFEAFMDQAVFVAQRIEAGDDPEELGRRLGLEIHLTDRSPSEMARAATRRRPPRGKLPPPERGLTLTRRDGRIVGFPPGPRNRIFVESSLGWVMVRRDLELDRPGQRLRLVLPLAALMVILLASGLAAAATRPLQAARQGMERIAAGDLDHRLEERGPTELARVARAFNAMADRIDGLLRTERELMAGVSHELRTPLARLRLELELLRDQGAPAKRVDAMEGDLAELDALIEELLHLSRLQLGDTRLELTPVDLDTLVRDTVELVGLETHEVVVRGEGGTVRGDRALLQRVLVNLLQNAARYAPAGTRVVVTAQAPRLVVEDEGPGVAAAARPHLFDPFWRGEGSRARATGGLGLGLMFVRQVVALHGGTVSAANRPRGGLRVTVVLGAPSG